MPTPIVAIRNLCLRHSQINWALADQTMVSGVNFLTGILMVRYLGLEEFGRFTLAWMTVLFFNSLQAAAIISPMMSIGPKQDENQRSVYYGAVMLQQLFWAGCSFPLLLLGVWTSQFIFPEWKIQMLALPLASVLTFFQLQDFLRRYFFSRGWAAHAFLNDGISYLGQLLLLIFLFNYIALDSRWVLWSIAGTSAIAFLVGLLDLGHLTFSRAELFSITSRHWRFARWLMASAILQWTSGNLFLVVAGNMLGPIAVGAVRAAQNIIGITHIIFQAMENFVPGRAAKAYLVEGAPGLMGYVKKVAWLGGAVIAIIAFTVSIFANFFLSILYGDGYSGCAYILRWFGPVYVSGFLILPLAAGLRALEKTRILFTSFFWISLFSLISAYPLISHFHIHGVMLGLLLVKLGMLLFLALDIRSQIKRCL